jgi:diguanylate cyclase (GGDEF)-like protein
MLHLLDGSAAGGPVERARMVEKARLAAVFADSIGLGIANLKLRESMRNLSIRDPLTGLFNRRYMEEGLAQELYRARRNDSKLAVIMIDIDHFKQFNDRYGHDGGDAVLRALGMFLKDHVRGSDIACRYGGEEFVLVLSSTTAEGALQRADAIRSGAALLSITHGNRPLGAITLSLGVAMFPEHGDLPAALVTAADIALYQAKGAGRDRVVSATGKAQQLESGASPGT